MFFRKRHKTSELQGDGGPFYFKVIPARYNRSREVEPPRFKVWIPLNARGYLWIGKETKWDRICKWLGLTSELETGIRDFDQNYFIATSHPRFIQTYLLDSTHQENLKNLFSSGYDQLLFDGTKLEIRYSEYRESIPDSGNLQIHAAEAPLRAIGQSLPGCFFGSSKLNYRITRWLNQMGGAAGLTILILSLIAGGALSAFVSVLDQIKLATFTAGYFIILLMVLLLPLIFYIRSHPIRGSQLLKFILLPLPGLMMCLHGILGISNQVFDPGPVSSYTLRVVNKHSQRNKNNTSYFVKVPSWNIPGEMISIPVRKSDYTQLEPNSSKIELRIGAGYFSHEWLGGYKVL